MVSCWKTLQGMLLWEGTSHHPFVDYFPIAAALSSFIPYILQCLKILSQYYITKLFCLLDSIIKYYLESNRKCCKIQILLMRIQRKWNASHTSMLNLRFSQELSFTCNWKVKADDWLIIMCLYLRLYNGIIKKER